MYKKRKTFTADIWIPYYNAYNNSRVSQSESKQIKLGCNRSISHSSDHIYTDGTIQTTPVDAMFAKPSKMTYGESIVTNLNPDYLKSNNNCSLGKNGFMNLSEKRIITSIKVECISNIISNLLKPSTYLEKSITSPTSTTDYETRINAYRPNPGGFVGFNIAAANFVYRMKDFIGKFHLFPLYTFHHSESLFETNDLQIELPKNYDLFLIPTFDWFKAINATYILSNGKQAMTVSKPYFQYKIDVTYITV